LSRFLLQQEKEWLWVGKLIEAKFKRAKVGVKEAKGEVRGINV